MRASGFGFRISDFGSRVWLGGLTRTWFLVFGYRFSSQGTLGLGGVCRAPSARPTWSQWRSHTSCQCPRTSRPTSPCTAIHSRFSVLLPRFGGTRGVSVLRLGFGVMNSVSTHTHSLSLSVCLASLPRWGTALVRHRHVQGFVGTRGFSVLLSGFRACTLDSASGRTNRWVGTCHEWCCYCIRGIRSVGGSRPSHLAQHERAQCSQAGWMEEPPDPMTPGRARRKWSLLGRGKAPLPCCLAPAPVLPSPRSPVPLKLKSN